VTKSYARETSPNLVWFFNECAENNPLILVGKESYYISGDGFLMPVKKGQKPPIRDISNRPGNSALRSRCRRERFGSCLGAKNACYLATGSFLKCVVLRRNGVDVGARPASCGRGRIAEACEQIPTLGQVR